MTVYFNNHTRHIVIINTDDGESIFLQPYETIPIVRNDSDVIKVLVKRNCDSYIYKHVMKSPMYHLVIESEIIFSGVSDGEVFNISREKIQFDLQSYYDRLFVLPNNAVNYTETHKIVAAEKIKTAYKKSHLRYIILFVPLEYTPMAVFWVFIGSIVTKVIWGWTVSIIFFLTAYLILIFLNVFLASLTNKILKKLFKFNSPDKDFYNYFENEYIKNYYADTKREPFFGNIEIN